MNNLRQYIIEKLKINKDSKISRHDMYYVIPRNDAFKECMRKYEYNRISTNNHGDTAFILWKYDIKYLLKKYADDLNIYEIPGEYNSLDTFKDDIEKFKIKIEDLIKIKNEDFR